VFDNRGWRRETRLDAYDGFVKAEHDFHNAVMEALDVVSEFDKWDCWKSLDEIDRNELVDDSKFVGPLRDFIRRAWPKVLDAELDLGRTGSRVTLAGPPTTIKAMELVRARAHAITNDRKNHAVLKQAAIDVESGNYEKLNLWIEAGESFENMARGVLHTDKQ
jgi:hypothetical protein